jgi:hypothetical protein
MYSEVGFCSTFLAETNTKLARTVFLPLNFGLYVIYMQMPPGCMAVVQVIMAAEIR